MTDLPNAADWICDTDDETFEQDVFERSHEAPVVVDFWAAWCQPCRALAPVLEQITKDSAGKFILAKADTDRTPQAAQQMNVQGIPAVFGVSFGQVVDMFTGALPPEQVQLWIDRLLQTHQLGHIERMEQSDAAAAEEAYREILAKSPNELAAHVGLARVLMEQGEVEEAKTLIEQLEQRGFLEAELENIKAALAVKGMEKVDVAAAQAAAASDPTDQQLQVKLAEALAADEQLAAAMDVCLRVIEQDKAGAGQQAREIMVNLFRVADDEELIRDYRRKLSLLLY